MEYANILLEKLNKYYIVIAISVILLIVVYAIIRLLITKEVRKIDIEKQELAKWQYELEKKASKLRYKKNYKR